VCRRVWSRHMCKTQNASVPASLVQISRCPKWTSTKGPDSQVQRISTDTQVCRHKPSKVHIQELDFNKHIGVPGEMTPNGPKWPDLQMAPKWVPKWPNPEFSKTPKMDIRQNRISDYLTHFWHPKIVKNPDFGKSMAKIPPKNAFWSYFLPIKTCQKRVQKWTPFHLEFKSVLNASCPNMPYPPSPANWSFGEIRVHFLAKSLKRQNHVCG